MTSHNDITGDKIQTRVTSPEYRDNYDKIFNKEVPCCGGSTSYTAPCVKEKPKRPPCDNYGRCNCIGNECSIHLEEQQR